MFSFCIETRIEYHDTLEYRSAICSSFVEIIEMKNLLIALQLCVMSVFESGFGRFDGRFIWQTDKKMTASTL